MPFFLLGSGFSHLSNAADNQDFSISGFGRVTAGAISTDKAEFRGYNNELSLRPNTLVGLQANMPVTNALSFTAQGVLRASETDESELDWLYASFQPEDNLSFKLGRLRTPFFMHSDVIDVGYSYHWITPPQQMYSAFLFPTFDGVDASWGYSNGGYDTSFETYLGQHQGDITLNNTTTDYDVELLGGFIASVRKDNFEYRASYHQGDVDIDVPQLDMLAGLVSNLGYYPSTVDSLASKGMVKVMQLGVRYDNFDYFAALEWMNINPELKTFMPEIDTFYITGGYVFNPVTVHLTYAKSNLKYNNFPNEMSLALADMSPSDPRYISLFQSIYGINAIVASRSTDNLESWTLGARWDIQPKLALKADVTFLIGDESDNAMFNSVEEDFDRRAELYQVSVEWVF